MCIICVLVVVVAVVILLLRNWNHLCVCTEKYPELMVDVSMTVTLLDLAYGTEYSIQTSSSIV